jgi:integrase
VSEVVALAEAMPASLQLAVLLACSTALRRAEILGLQRRDVDVGAGTLTIRQTKVITVKNNIVVTEPASAVGRANPSHPTARPYRGEGPPRPPRRGCPDDAVFDCTIQEFHTAWERVRRSIDREDLYFHDLRLAGFTVSALAGATIAEIMHRAGHSSPTTARRYHRATAERDRALAAAMAELAHSSEPSPPST